MITNNPLLINAIFVFLVLILHLGITHKFYLYFSVNNHIENNTYKI